MASAISVVSERLDALKRKVRCDQELGVAVALPDRSARGGGKRRRAAATATVVIATAARSRKCKDSDDTC